MFCVSPCILQRTGFVACECHDDLTASHHPFCYIFHHLACLEKKKKCPDQLFGKQRIQNTNYITTSVGEFSVRGLAFGDNDIPAGTLVLKQGSRMASE